MENRQIIQNSIIADMSEGVMAIRFDGKIIEVNDACLEILQKRRDELEGHSFVECFFESEDLSEQNDAFTECVLDAVYSKKRRQESYVPYYAGGVEKQLRVVSSYLKDSSKVIGVVLVISDITELTEMRDAVKALEKIRDLNHQLELRNRILQETFGRYLAEDVVQEILDTPGGWKLGGQKRRLTILMSDLRGFTSICGRMEAEDLIAMLNHYFSLMYEEISRRGGTLIEFLGDGMFVIFGAPTRTQTHAADAVAAAVAMQQRMKEVNAWNAGRGYPLLSMGIGINTDEVILGNLGSERRTKYGVVGQAVNLAGRLESFATDGQILLTPQTRAEISVPLTVAKVFPLTVKGVPEPVEVTCVSGIGAPYHLFLHRNVEEDDALVPLEPPVPVLYHVLNGKYVDGTSRTGRLLALSDRGAVLQTEAVGRDLNPGEAEAASRDSDPGEAEAASRDSDPGEAKAAGRDSDSGEAEAAGRDPGPEEAPENLLLQVGEGLYGRVTDREGGNYTIRFTGKPAEFEQWKNTLIGTGWKKGREKTL